ncbi:MAG TPA: hypothetical protein VKB38_03205 [Terracidiphilus sp.]|nr:hypothetical protein [Terracidiphilus sp.]
MSIFSSILGWFKHTLPGQNPQSLAAEAHAAQIAINLLTPGLVIAIQQAGASESSADVTNVATQVSNDLNTLSKALSDVQAGKNASATVVSALNSIKANLQSLLAAGHIKDPKTVATITTIVNAFVAEADAVSAEFS